MRFTSRFNAKAGFADLWDYVREPRPYRWPLLAVSFAIPMVGLVMLSQESHFRPPDAPEVTYISTFAADRTDEEIRRTNLENQARKEARAAKDFATSDAIRDELSGKGVEVMDGDPLGWDWKL